MDQLKPGSMEFLDLSDVDERERSLILSSLQSRNPNIELPWVDDELQWDQGYVPCPKPQPLVDMSHSNSSPSNLVVTANINVHDAANPAATYPHQIFVTGSPYNYQQQPHPNVLTTFVVNSNINYASNAFINTKVEITQGFKQSNQPESEPDLEVPPPNSIKDESNLSINGNAAEENHVAAPARMSWASLFNKGKDSNESNGDVVGVTTTKPLAVVAPFVQHSMSNRTAVAIENLKEPLRSNVDDPVLHRLGEFLASYNIDNRVISLQPRGLINKSNYCYINSILQALLACPPFYNLLSCLAETSNPSLEKKKINPMIDSMIKFVREFSHLPAGMRIGRRPEKTQKKESQVGQVNCEMPFEPYWIHKMLSGLRSDTFVVEGRQEDAEEFLGCLLNGLNDEMLELMKLVGYDGVTRQSAEGAVQEEDKEWQVMGPKNKGAITRRTEFSRTPINDVFGGLLRSRIHRTGDQSTDNIQPFFTLQLNIEKATKVEDALEVLVCKNQLEGVTSSRTNEEVEAWQQVTLEELPIVLILHLQCFDYKLDGCSKIVKALEFPVDLKIDAKLLSSKRNYTSKEKQYKLFAVVYHEGKEATKGHYITDAYHVGYASWLRYDDASVKPVPEEHVLRPHGTRVPYLLFYRRNDSLKK